MNEMAISTWAKFNKISVGKTVVACSMGEKQYQIKINDYDKKQIDFIVPTRRNYISFSFHHEMIKDVWHHIVGRYYENRGYMTIDNNKKDMLTQTFIPSRYVPDVYGHGAADSIDAVRIYETLSDDQIMMINEYDGYTYYGDD